MLKLKSRKVRAIITVLLGLTMIFSSSLSALAVDLLPQGIDMIWSRHLKISSLKDLKFHPLKKSNTSLASIT